MKLLFTSYDREVPRKDTRVLPECPFGRASALLDPHPSRVRTHR
ncbi:hypothetical protein ATK86_4947 [Nocardia fluminea]|uniref:Uncharacterized protein n=1 Tax=Nocardia fluminea TaxID=134984 RepID=A0A2N3VFV5_9NOCA|nr:hypothetical protein ATK86_4947 [Nocardia fluminea]